MNVTLVWNGPAGAGAFPTDPAALQDMFLPGVYLRIKRYDRDRLVSYVGQSKSLLTRIDQHLAQVLAFQHALRDPAGEVWMRGDFEGRLQCYRDVEQPAAMAAAEARRMRFFWAACDDDFHVECLGVVEAALKLRLEENAGAENGLATVENVQGVPVGIVEEPVYIENDLGALAAEDRDTVRRLLGEAPIAYAETVAGEFGA